MPSPSLPPPDTSHLRDCHAGTLPRGCRDCRRGAKLVLFITGRCAQRCYYCPISKQKWLADVIYANERFIGEGGLGEAELKAICEEAEAMGATGTGITGGDPMDKPARVLRAVRGLKSRLGPDHHIHLYTSGGFEARYLAELAAAGLDEIRFHPMVSTWKGMAGSKVDKLIRGALATSMRVGVEVPVLPGRKAELEALIEYLEEVGAGFLNLNELEISDTNYQRMEAEGMSEAKSDTSVGTKGSEVLALELVEAHAGPLTVHYCSAGFKDGVQLRGRLLRRGKRTAKPYEELTPDGTLIKGVIEVPVGDKKGLDKVMELLLLEYELPTELLGVDREHRRLELPAQALEDLVDRLDWPCFIVEELPTATRLEVERRPLPDKRSGTQDRE